MSTDPRHSKRIRIVQDLFAQSFHTQPAKQPLTSRILKHTDTIDTKIQKAAPEWPLEKIARVDLAILRLSVYELFIESKQPPKVIINEAVELAKELGGERSSAFINGVLGTLVSKKQS